MTKIDYGKISKSNVLVHKVNEIVKVKFLDEGSMDKTTIFDEKKQIEKEVDKYTYQIVDLSDNIEKEYSALAKAFVLRIKEVLPIKGKSFRISKFKTGNEVYDVDYKIELID